MVARIDGCIEVSEGKRPSMARERERLRALVARYGEVRAIMEYFRCHPGDPLACPEEWVGLFPCDDAIGECVI
jgi:hypothetical protein